MLASKKLNVLNEKIELVNKILYLHNLVNRYPIHRKSLLNIYNNLEKTRQIDFFVVSVYENMWWFLSNNFTSNLQALIVIAKRLIVSKS